jgi:hypothetical protein
MNTMSKVLPWIVTVALSGGAWFFYAGNKAKEQELQALRASAAEVKSLRLEKRDIEKIRWKQQELARLQRDNEELHRLRQEIQRLGQHARTGPVPANSPPPADSFSEIVITAEEMEANSEPITAEMIEERITGEMKSLQSIASSFLSFAEANNGMLPRSFDDLRDYVEAPEEFFVHFPSDQYEILAPEHVIDIQDPEQQILFRSKDLDQFGMRSYVYADGRVEKHEEAPADQGSPQAP